MLTRFFALTFLYTSVVAGYAADWTVDWSNPKVFIENKGQFRLPWEKPGEGSEVLYAVDNGSTMIYFTARGISYTFFSRTKDHVVLDKSQYKSWEEYRQAKAKYKMMCISDAVHMNFSDASPNVALTASRMNPLTHSYAVNVNGEDQQFSNMRSFEELVYKGIYPGIDIRYRFHPETGLKYDIILWPGADPSQIQMVYTGMDALSLDAKGNLKVMTTFGPMTDHAPVTHYDGSLSEKIHSNYTVNGSTVGFNLGSYDKSRKVVIDPWTVTPAFPNSGKIWECEKDAAGNAYIYGGDTPMRLRKYNSTGTLQWTYNSTWDTSGFWVGTFIVDQAGNSYITSGSNGEIRKVNTGGASVWYNNPNGFFGPIYEYWHLTFNCDETVLVCGGMRAQSPLSINSYRGAIMNININTGAIIGTPLTVGWMQGLNIKEVRTICSSPNQNYYFLTLDSVGMMTNTFTLGWKSTSGYNFAYGIPNYGVTNQGISSIRATSSFIYTQNGTTLHKRNIANGAIVATAAIPGGGSSSVLGMNTPHNSGLDLDNCGNVYVGSTTGVHKFDANLNFIASAATTNAVYDVAVSPSGEVLACGNGFFSSIATLAPCAVVTLTCSSNPLTVTASGTNPLCNGQCTGTATAAPSGGTGPYTYSWAPSGGTNASASGLCAGTYTVTITDATPSTVTATVTITQPSAITSSISAQTNVLCNGQCTGSVTVTSSGGTGGHSYSWAPSGGNAATATGLCANTYTCTITDANGCTRTQTVVISQPTALSGTTSSTNTSCTGNTGTASVTASGGTGPYTYNWTPSGGTNANATGLGAGTYTVTVTDANNCTFTATAAVGTTNGPTVTLSSQTNILCNGASTGSVTVNVTGGTSPYTYAWSPSGGTNATATGLAAGPYTVTVTDANNCVQVFTVTITEPTAISATTTANPTNCGATTGSVSTSASGGTGPYTYLWQPGGNTTSSVSNLGAGVYTVTITDANNCTMTATASVINLNGPTGTLSSQSNVTCNGSANGSATVSANGGTSPYTYSWSPSGGTNASATGLSGGTYTVTITDAGGCTSTVTVTITEPAALGVTLNGTNASCGFNNGSVTSSVTGGTTTYTYSWQPGGATSSSVSGLGAGTYTCTVTDANGCTTVSTVTLTSSTGLNVTISNDTTISAGQNVQLNAGTGVSYSWSPSSGLSCTTCPNPVANPTATTTYTVIVTDANGCTGLATVTISVLNQCGDNGTLFVPDAFSPNGDLANDFLFVRGPGISEFYFAVYDRWGEKVFESTDQTIGWDGMYKGKACDPAVFVYYLKAICYTGTEIIQKGNVTLFR